MAELIANISPVVTYIIQNIPTVADTIVQSPILLASFGFFMIGGVVGIFGRLLSRG